MKHPRAVDLMPALAMKKFHRAPKKRLGLWGTLVVSNLVWIGTAAILISALWSTTKLGTAMTEFYLSERAKWIAADKEKQDQLNARNLEIARLVAFQTSQSPADVVQLANKISSVLNSAYGDRRSFLEEALPQAIRMQVQYGIPASAILAQAIYESGYGQSDLAKQYHNYFGMKAYNWDGPKVNMPTKDNGVKTTAYFRVYSTLGDGFEGYANFLKGSGRYANAFYKESGDEFVRAVLKAGYCPDGDYYSNIKVIMARHRLQELDSIIKAGAEAPYQVAWGKDVAKNSSESAEVKRREPAG